MQVLVYRQFNLTEKIHISNNADRAQSRRIHMEILCIRSHFALPSLTICLLQRLAEELRKKAQIRGTPRKWTSLNTGNCKRISSDELTSAIKVTDGIAEELQNLYSKFRITEMEVTPSRGLTDTVTWLDLIRKTTSSNLLWFSAIMTAIMDDS
jgi:hypothetical protein